MILHLRKFLSKNNEIFEIKNFSVNALFSKRCSGNIKQNLSLIKSQSCAENWVILYSGFEGKWCSSMSSRIQSVFQHHKYAVLILY